MHHAIVGHGIHLDVVAHDGERLHAVGVIGSRDGDLQGRVRLSLEFGTDAVAAPSLHAVAVDDVDAVARSQSGARGGASLIGARDIHARSAVGALHDVGTYAAILPRGHHVEVVHVLGGDVLGVGVDVVEHGVDGILDGAFGIQRVHIVGGEFAIERVEDVEVAHDGRIVARGVVVGEQGEAAQEHQCQRKETYVFFHREMCRC